MSQGLRGMSAIALGGKCVSQENEAEPSFGSYWVLRIGEQNTLDTFSTSSWLGKSTFDSVLPITYIRCLIFIG